MRSQGRLALWLLLAPALLWLTLLVVLPHVDMVLLALSERVRPRVYEYGLGNFAEFFKEPLYWHTFARTAVFSVLATLLTLLIAFPTAYYIAKLMRGRAKSLAFIACLLPFWVSELVRTLGWIILLRETGVISTFLVSTGLAADRVELLYNDAAILVGLVYSSLLFMVVPLVTSLDTLDDAMIEAGYDLGGSGFDVLREIVVPHAMPGIMSGSIVVFMLTLGNYVTPTLLGGKNSLWFTEQIYNQFITRFNWELGSAFGILLLLVSSGIVWAGLKLSRQSLGTVVRA
ncbi:MAG: ABC transporter permease [Hyphomicrobiales bacterium]